MINIEQKLKSALRRIAGGYNFITKEEADDLRKKVTKPIYSKKFKKYY